MHELTGTGKTGAADGASPSLARAPTRWPLSVCVDSLATPWRPSGIGISPVGYSVKHDADRVGAAL